VCARAAGRGVPGAIAALCFKEGESVSIARVPTALEDAGGSLRAREHTRLNAAAVHDYAPRVVISTGGGSSLGVWENGKPAAGVMMF
jgi:hypothetical protein